MSGTRKPTYLTQSARRRRQALLRFGVWIFLLVFAVSVVGGLFAVGLFVR